MKLSMRVLLLGKKKDVEKFKHIENIKIPKDIDYEKVHGLSN